ncbi:MAG: signal peptidase I [Dehalococcoidia bacterium]|nr:signal peptidase I [Dehalococcoidia bacterium]
MKTFSREILVPLILAVAIFFLLRATVQSFVVVECCMEPNFESGERLLVNKVVYHFREPERGDVIILHPPLNPEAVYIKRIIALSGDTVEIKMGAVYINGSKLNEPYIKEPPSYTFPQEKIPKNEYFVLGDNRNNANDSHKGWTVPRQNIIGKAWLSFWPPSEWGLVANYSLEEQLEAVQLLDNLLSAKGAIWQQQ